MKREEEESSKKANQSDFQMEERRCFKAGSSFLFLPKKPAVAPPPSPSFQQLKSVQIIRIDEVTQEQNSE